jgi:hypothetical protein
LRNRVPPVPGDSHAAHRDIVCFGNSRNRSGRVPVRRLVGGLRAHERSASPLRVGRGQDYSGPRPRCRNGQSGSPARSGAGEGGKPLHPRRTGHSARDDRKRHGSRLPVLAARSHDCSIRLNGMAGGAFFTG